MQGVDILSHPDPTPGIWARVAGDMLDLAVLGVAATKTRKPGAFAAIATMVLGIGAADMLACGRLTQEKQLSWPRRAMARAGRMFE